MIQPQTTTCRWCGTENYSTEKTCFGCHQDLVPPERVGMEGLSISHVCADGALVAFIGADLCRNFLYICSFEGDGFRVHRFRHDATGREVHVADDGTPYRLVNGTYEEIMGETALRSIFS